MPRASASTHEETHGLFLYDSTLKVPMIVRYPSRIAAGTKFDGLLSGRRSGPDAPRADGTARDARGAGRSRAARLLGGSGPEREVIYAGIDVRRAHLRMDAALRAAVVGGEIHQRPRAGLYNLRRDPFETINVASQEAKAVDESWRPSLDEALRVIGGAQIAGVAGASARRTHRNLAGLVMAHNLYMRARTTIEEGRPASAAPFLQQALGEIPAIRAGHRPSRRAARRAAWRNPGGCPAPSPANTTAATRCS